MRAQQASVLARTLEDFVADGVLDATMATLLRATVRTRKNIVITGRQAAGNTSLLRALCAECDPAASIITVEQEPELLLDKLPALQPAKRVVPMKARNDTADQPPTAMKDLVVEATRLKVTRLIVADIRGPEIAAFWLMHGEGVMATMHAAEARQGFNRLVMMAMEDGWSNTDHAQRVMAEHIDLVMHLDYRPAGETPGVRRRVISTITAPSFGEDATISITEVYAPDADGNPVPGEVPAAQLVTSSTPASTTTPTPNAAPDQQAPPRRHDPRPRVSGRGDVLVSR